MLIRLREELLRLLLVVPKNVHYLRLICWNAGPSGIIFILKERRVHLRNIACVLAEGTLSRRPI